MQLLPLEQSNKEHAIRLLVSGDDSLVRSVEGVVDGKEFSLVRAVATADDLLEELSQGGIDCVIVSRSVGGGTRDEFPGVVASRFDNPPPIVVVDHFPDTVSVVAAFRSGVADIVSLDGAPGNELVRAVRRSVKRFHRLQALLDEMQHLSRMARYDRLTGLPNRNFLEDRLTTLIASSQRHGNPFAVLLIDINKFKKINDIYGHTVGDQAIRAFSKKLRGGARTSDAYGRHGGDEFLYLIDRDVTEAAIEQACNRLSSVLSFPLELEAVSLSISASIGAAIFPGDGQSAEDLLVAADHAMYAAKLTETGYCLANSVRGRNYDDYVPSATAAAFSNAAHDRSSPVAVSAPAHPPPPRPGAEAEQSDEDLLAIREENRRRERRNRVFQRGRIILGDGFSTIDCIIRDLSPHGARISVDGQIAVPQQFSFSVLGTGAVHRAERRWQRGGSIGMAFVDEAKEKKSAGGAA